MIVDALTQTPSEQKESEPLLISGQVICLEAIERAAIGRDKVSLCPRACERMRRTRAVVDQIVAEGRPVYGVSTGFGRLCDFAISPDDLEELQLNLVRSHCCGVGPLLSKAETRAMMLLRANVLAIGNSGARPELALALCDFLNAGIWPEVPSKGSVGASGDLAPLAHIALCLIGEGFCVFEGVRMPTVEAMRYAGLEPLQLRPKEGLSLINGTQALTAVGALAVLRLERLTRLADIAASLTADSLRGHSSPFDPRIHDARPHRGQGESARLLREMLEGSEIQVTNDQAARRVQDAYSLRCIPQVHGAVRGAVEHVRGTVEIETGSATDNPLVFEDGSVRSGGNFHGAPLAMAYDYAAIAAASLVGICERRVERLLNPDLNEGLPAFLAPTPGLSSGLMIAHVTLVALLNEIKVLCSPASIDNLPTSAGTEDHVSMGMTAALKLRSIVENAERCIAIELIAAVEALEHRRPLRTGHRGRAVAEIVRSTVPPLLKDRVLSQDIENLAEEIALDRLRKDFLKSTELRQEVAA